MKKLLTLFIIIITLNSCTNDPILKLVKNPSKITTTDMQEKLQDTIHNYVFYLDNEKSVYLISKETKLVAYKIQNNTGSTAFTILILFISVVVLVVLVLEID